MSGKCFVIQMLDKIGLNKLKWLLYLAYLFNLVLKSWLGVFLGKAAPVAESASPGTGWQQSRFKRRTA